jgi:antitoxin component YwqK of YwqJK toxin-antitoxin module
MNSLKTYWPLLFSLSLLLASCTQVKTDYYPNGKIRSEITMDGKRYYGPAYFYYEDGTLLMECSYLNDSLDGKLVRYFETGRMKEMMFYHKNRPDSLYKLWNPQGQLLMECFYKDSLLDGNYRDYYTSGQVKSSGEYHAGEPIGLWLFYDQNGYIIRKESH